MGFFQALDNFFASLLGGAPTPSPSPAPVTYVPSPVEQASTTDFFSLLGDFFNSIFSPMQSQQLNGYSPTVQDYGVPGGSGDALTLARQIITQEEGVNYRVYYDNAGNLTVGIGHKVTAADGLSLGDTISQEKVDAFFNSDIASAYSAAQSQSAELGQANPNFIANLTSVNFQLGTGWRSKFYNTWNLLVNGDVSSAIQHLYQSAWYQQTPSRVDNFVASLQNDFVVA